MSENQQYIVSARKYRPATFRSVVGQKALTATLKNAIDSNRLAQAYLFCGPRGVGKTSCARIFAKTINCLHRTPDGEACGECESCRAIDQGNSFNLTELDAASNNSVDDIRSITEQVNVPPQVGRYRVFIIDEVHMLSNAAFNAFLKTLEEPPKFVVFILATTEKHKVIPTILSRCQIYDFKRITVNDMIDHLEYVAGEEGIAAEREALGVIALKADGAMRDALSIFDQVAASSRGQITYQSTIDNLNVLDHEFYFRLVEAARSGDVPQALVIYNEVREKGFDSLFFINGLAAHVRDLMVAADPRTRHLLETSEEVAEKYAVQSKTLPVEWYYAAMRLLNDCDLNYRTATSKRLLVELTLIRLCQLLKPATPPFDSLDPHVPLRDPAASRPSTAPSAPHAGRSSGPTREEGTPGGNVGGQPAAKTPPPPPAVSEPAVAMTPAPSSAASAPASATGKIRILNRPSGVRLSEVATAVEEKKPSTLDHRTTPFTKERFMEGWNGFIARNPALHILCNTMRTAAPEPVDATSYRIVVGHPAQAQAFELSMTKLLKFLRDFLDNDSLTLHVEVSTESAGAKQLPPREFLKQVVTDNPAMKSFLGTIEAELI